LIYTILEVINKVNIIIAPIKGLHGSVPAPPSKSCTHRAIIIASLSDGGSTIGSALLSADTKASLAACKAFGAKIELKRNKVLIEGVAGKPTKPDKTIDVANSGTTLRIMAAVASLCSGWVTLSGDESIRKRPMQPLLTALGELGALTSSNNGKAPVKVSGPLRGGVCCIRGDVSSQFISALLIAAPLARGDIRIEVTTSTFSRPYIDLTLQAMKEAGVTAETTDYGFQIKGAQTYHAKDYVVEGDYSSAAFVLAAAAITGSEVTVNNLRSDSLQGDRKIIEILQKMGCRLETEDGGVKVKAVSELHGVELDMSETPDLVPITAVLACFAKGETLIKNVAHLRFKESDRLRAMATELSKMGAKITEGDDFLRIEGSKPLSGGRLCGWNDHRIVMALSVAALRAGGRTTIDSAESIDVSFPGYVSAMNDLGADMRLTEG
jgi:3-phosphoshikimate 1-carboxyvinyltransferase